MTAALPPDLPPGATADAPPLEGQLCFALYGASMAMTRVYKPMLDRLGLTYPQYLLLQALWEEDGRTVGAAAARLGLEPSTVTPLAKRLAAAGLVTRERDARDERQVRLRLTPAGTALRAEGACLSAAVQARAGLDADALAALTAQVSALRRALTGAS